MSRLRFVTYDPEPAVRKDITPFILPIKTNIVPRQANIVHDAEHRIDRARAYIEKMPPAISGQHGHDAALNVANKLYEFGLTENEAFRVFKEDYNHRCHPEWSDNEMQHKISEAFNKPLNEHGSKLRKNEQSKPDSRQQQSKKVEKRLRLTLSSEVVEKEITWLWCNKIPCGMLSLIAGLAGVGKSFWTVYMTAVITNGWDWPDGSPCERGSVLFFYGEEGIADTYKKRFQANGADQSKIVFLNGIESIDENKGHSEIDVTLEMVAEIEQAVKETAEKTGLFVKMVVIDPISNYWGNTKEDSNTGVRSVLKPLQLLAEKTGVAFVLIQHVGKGEKTYAQQRVLGSTGIVAACRSVWGIFIDPVDKDKRIFAKLKVNCGFNHTAVSYKIVPPDGKVEIVEASIEGLTGDDIESVRKAAQQVSQGRPPKAVAEVMAWLQNFLADGPKPSKVIMKEAKAKSFSKSTLDRAKENLSIKPKKDGMGGWTWELPSPEDTQI